MTTLAHDQNTKAVAAWLHLFDRRPQPEADAPPWLAPLRQAGRDQFAALGFPTLQHEDWRFTNLTPLTRLHFKPAPAPGDELPSAATLGSLTFAQLTGPYLVFVNGHYQPGLSSIASLPAGVRISPLSQAIIDVPDLAAAHLAQVAVLNGDAFAALNTAFLTDGAFIHVPAGAEMPEPVRLLYLTTTLESGASMHPRNLLIVDPEARLTLIESYVGLSNARTFTNAVTECVLGERSTLEHIKFQDESLQSQHIAGLHARLGHESRFALHSFALGARLSRNNIRTHLAGEHIECVLNGLYLTREDQLADHHMVVEHSQPHCASHEYFNGILDDKSKGVFHGRILVQPEAQKTDAKQTNRNLLLSNDATVNTKPQLEIYADDVKCTHGATVGQMNQDAIFYLRSRGLDLSTARRLLMHAFAGEIVDRVQLNSARQALHRLMWNRLEQNPHIAGSV